MSAAGCPADAGSPSPTVTNAVLAALQSDGSDVRRRQTRVCDASAVPGPGELRPPFCTPAFLFLRPPSLTSCAGRVCHVFSHAGCLARDPRGLLMA